MVGERLTLGSRVGVEVGDTVGLRDGTRVARILGMLVGSSVHDGVSLALSSSLAIAWPRHVAQ